MSPFQLALLLIYSLGLLVGQVLFKLAAKTAAMAAKTAAGSSLLERGWGIVANIYFLTGAAIYFALSVFWVWLLTQVPLSKAYPFVAINFILAAVAGMLFFGETVSLLNAAGLLMIVAGIVLATG